MSQVVMQAYRFALDPTPAQQRGLAAHAGAARFAFNWALAAVKANIGQRAAERSYGIAEDELTPALGWNLPALRRAWNQAKAEVAPWWAECSKEAFNTGLGGLARALGNFSASRSGKRAGRRVGFPRFRSRRRAVPSVRFTTGTIRVESKMCSGCGAVKAKLPLRVRTFTCEHCGLSLDRDLNAACNLAQLVTRTTGTGVAGDPTPNGVNGRGADQKTTLVVAGGCEASTPHRVTGQDGDRLLATASCE